MHPWLNERAFELRKWNETLNDPLKNDDGQGKALA